jgi:hypothetical protein
MPVSEERPRKTDNQGNSPNPLVDDVQDETIEDDQEQPDETRHGKRQPSHTPDNDSTTGKESERKQQAPREGEERGGSRRNR